MDNTAVISYGETDWVYPQVILHEILHTYMYDNNSVEDLKYPPMWDGEWNASYEKWGYYGGYMMGGPSPPDLSQWYLHPETETRVALYICQYDGLDW